jgi:hypothetical protein
MKRRIVIDVANSIKNTIINLWVKPSAKTMAQHELDDARRFLLLNQSLAEYHTQMNVYYQKSITRLENFLREDAR